MIILPRPFFYMFYQENPLSLRLSAEESVHCTKVLRHQLGDSITIFDGKGNVMDCIITKLGKEVGFEIVKVNHFDQPVVNYEIAVAPPKSAQRFDFMIEKMIELGVQKIYLLKTAHSERNHFSAKRLEKQIIATCKQCKTYYLPQIELDADFKTLLTPDFEHYLFYCGNEHPKKPFNMVLENSKKSRFYIGPEGDFSLQEVNFFMAKNGILASLGTQRLRTETAAIHVASSLYLHKF